MIEHPAVVHPFFELAPQWSLYPLVALACAATVIASQSLISGTFSLTRQLMHEGYSPLVTVRHTSPEMEGQIYIWQVNWTLCLVCVMLVLGFRSSERLAAAYGLAVSGTMTATTLLFYKVTQLRWRWPRLASVAVTAGFLVIDLAFLLANLAKIGHGGWVPLALAALALFIFLTWREGRDRIMRARRERSIPLNDLMEIIRRERPLRAPGTGIFLTANEDNAPQTLRAVLLHVHTLPEEIVLVAVRPCGEPRVPAEERIRVERKSEGVYTARADYGYMQSIAFSDILSALQTHGVRADPEQTTFYVARERLRRLGGKRIAKWRKKIFIFLHRNAPDLQDFLALPSGQVMEIAMPIDI
jgi:KUP system potassium uptake protein